VSQVLYRKYRSRKLSDIVGQDAVIKALNNALEAKKISHAYLFAGPRGVGKTSVARILAHKINDLNYTSDQMPIDIIEIDAASNRRIEEIRDLREKVAVAPVSAKYKVYIIDEVHMLTREAFNALLKTLEEPPDHVVFILATTEPHKIPETIISRTQKYNFKLASTREVVHLLQTIAKKEHIDISNEALNLIAEHSGGSLRDAVSLLDQARHSGKKIDTDTIARNFGLPAKKIISTLINEIRSGSAKELLSTLSEAYENGASASLLANQIIFELRQAIKANKLTISNESALALMKNLLSIGGSNHPEARLEISLIECQLAEDKQQNTSEGALFAAVEPPLTVSPSKAQSQSINEQTAKEKSYSEDLWPRVLDKIKSSHSTLYSILKSAQVQVSQNPNTIQITLSHPFHLKRMQESKNKRVVVDTVNSLNGVSFEIIFNVRESNSLSSSVKKTQPRTADIEKSLYNIQNVFGKAEVI